MILPHRTCNDYRKIQGPWPCFRTLDPQGNVESYIPKVPYADMDHMLEAPYCMRSYFLL